MRNSPIAHRWCGRGNCLAPLEWLLLHRDSCETWSLITLVLRAGHVWLSSSMPGQVSWPSLSCVDLPHIHLWGLHCGRQCSTVEMLRIATRSSGLVIITTTTSDVYRRDRNSDFCLFTFLWPWFLCSSGEKQPKFPSLSSCTLSTCLQCPFLFVTGTVNDESSGFTVNPHLMFPFFFPSGQGLRSRHWQ